MRFWVLSLVVLVILSGLVVVNSPTAKAAAPYGLSWSSAAPLPKPTAQAAVVTGHDGRIYVFGGYTAAPTPSNPANDTAQAYDLSTNTWSTLASMPQATRGAAVAVGKNGLIYVIAGTKGGVSPSCCLSNTQVYNPITNTWMTKAPIPTHVWEAAAAAGDDGKIYVFGGTKQGDGNDYTFGGDTALTMVQIYDPTLDTWTIGAPMPTGRYELGVVKAPTGIMYAMGGQNGSLIPLATVEQFDPVANSWASAAPMPRAEGLFATSLGPDGLIYVFGGSPYWSEYYGDQVLGTVEAYDSSSNTWYTVGNMLTRAKEVSAAKAPDGRMFIIGGENGTTNNPQLIATNQIATVNFPNTAPVAIINSITPSPVRQGATVTFNGSGTDSDGTIVAYKWRSSISGIIGTSASFTTSTLLAGTHNIYFSVQDNQGAWSPEVSGVLIIDPSVANDPTLSQLGTLLTIEIVTLAAAIAAVIVSLYSLTRLRRSQPLKT
jgi:N-acetylneuraminic acid mutarotase